MSEWRSLVAQARRFNPTVADALLGAFLLVIALPQLFIEDPAYRHLGTTFRAGSLLVAGFRPTVADLGLVVAVYSVAGHSSRRSAVISGLAFLVALAAVTSIESTGRQALSEMRRLVGVLRNGDEPTSLDPQPRLTDVPALVEQARKSGLEVELDVKGEPRPLPAGIDLSAYRIVQEALTNVRKHAGPARVEIRVHYGTGSLHIEVTDDRHSVSDHASPNGNRGQGLIGMRERVALYGGKLEVGPRPQGGFHILADLPLEAAAR